MDRSGWPDYWERLQGQPRVFQAEAEHFVASLQGAVPISNTWSVLDFGCGFGFASRALAPLVSRVYAWDAAENMRKHARRCTADHGNVRCPETLPEHLRFDLILVNSVVQYMTIHELGHWLRRWAALCRSDSRIVISDIIPEMVSTGVDVIPYLAFAFRGGLLGQAVLQGIREIRHYARTRSTCPLLLLDPSTVTAIAADAGLDTVLLPRNLTYRRQRYSCCLRTASAAICRCGAGDDR